jgi:hypothetical protein
MAPAPLFEPTQFLLEGYGIGITYETTSFQGAPRFSLVRQGQNFNFSGAEIQVELTQLGKMVTVNLSANQGLVDEALIAADTVETVTLLVPEIGLSATNITAPIQTIAIFRQSSSPVKTVGQSQIYMTVYLSGTANKVDF